MAFLVQKSAHILLVENGLYSMDMSCFGDDASDCNHWRVIAIADIEQGNQDIACTSCHAHLSMHLIEQN